MTHSAELVPGWLTDATERAGHRYLAGLLTEQEASAEVTAEIMRHPEYVGLLVKAEIERALDEWLAERTT